MFNTFFSKVVPNLNLDNNLGNNITSSHITDPVFCAVKKYENHPSILKIKEMMGQKKTYHFPLNLLIERKDSMNYKN